MPPSRVFDICDEQQPQTLLDTLKTKAISKGSPIKSADATVTAVVEEVEPKVDTKLNPKSDYTVRRQPLGTTKHVRIVVIGAGASGLNMIRTARRNLVNFELVVYEKNPDVGGTWCENRYPGCRCDIPSHNYQFAWRPNSSWSEFYSEAPEIHEYFRNLCDEEHMWDAIKLSHAVSHAQWSEQEGKWVLKVTDLNAGQVLEDRCDFLLDGSGILNNWKWPSIPGLQSFQGHLVHSANWPKDFDYRDKKVAVIGNGSSGVQIVPTMQPDVKQLVHIIRSATWIAPPGLENMIASTAGGTIQNLDLDGLRFTEKQIQQFKEDPAMYMAFVKATEQVVNSKFDYLVNDSPLQAAYRSRAEQYMKTNLQGDQRLIDVLVPDFPYGCRRITPGVGYLESLHKENVRVVTEKVAEVVPQGLKLTTGEVIEVDAIVCATGFDVSFRPRFPLIGRKGNLQDIWEKNLPKAYMSCAVPDFPNYFVFLGPNAPIGHGSVLTISEHVAKYMVKMITKCQVQNIKAVAPKQEALDDFFEHISAFMPNTAWAGTCSSWFKNGTTDGPVTALHPGSRIHWFHMLEQFRGEDYDYTPHVRNRFSYLGNGYSTREDKGQDSTWYLDKPDEMF